MLRFAVAGCPHTTPKPGGTVEGLKRAHALGIRAMEIEWVQMVPRDPRRMLEIRAAAEELDIALTVHAPYYINLNSSEPDKLAASKKRILDALSMAQLAGAVSVCVHAAFYQGKTSQEVTDTIRRAVEDIMQKKSEFFPDVNLALETMGKPSQWGTLEEALTISKEFDLYPCLDAAHLHARTNGQINTTEEWNSMFDVYESYLGKKSLSRMHLHYSGIAYGPKGEKNHLPFSECDGRWQDYLSVLKKRKIGGVLVCESPLLEADTVLLQEKYETY